MSRSDFEFSYLRQVNFHEVGGNGLLHDHQAVQLVNEAIREFLRSLNLDMPRQSTVSSWQTSRFTIFIHRPITFDCYLEIFVSGKAVDESRVIFTIEAFERGSEQPGFQGEVVWHYLSQDGMPPGIETVLNGL